MIDVSDYKILSTLDREIYPVLPDKISSVLKKMKSSDSNYLEEIRLRAEKPLMINKNGKEYFLLENGVVSTSSSDTMIIKKQDIEKTLQLMCDFSLYSIEDELKQGFITIRGGHRIGVTGRAVMEDGKLKTLKNISGMNIRIVREVKGCGAKIIDMLYSKEIYHTLIASPPGCGKTTLLRDIIRTLSTGKGESKINGYKVGLIDERSEIAGCYMGVPQRDVGIRTDVLDACPKAQGMIMLLRSMAPEIIAVDEIGSLKDSEAIEDAVNSGVKVIATVHGRDLNEIKKRPAVNLLIQNKNFQKLVILSRKNGPGTIEEIIDL